VACDYYKIERVVAMSNNYWDDDEEEVEIPDHQLDGDALVKKTKESQNVPMRSVSRNLPTNLTDTSSRSGNKLSLKSWQKKE
jgi:hypothetical protein